MGYILAFITIFIWSINIILAKYFAVDVLPLQISLGRWIVAAAVLLPFTVLELWHKRDLVWAHLKYITVLAILGVILSNTLIYKAAQTAAPINIGLLQITFPLFLTALSVAFLGVRLKVHQGVGILIAILGVITVLVRGDFSVLSQIKIHIGDGFMLLNTAFFALYSFLQTKRPKELSQQALLSATAMIGVVLLVPLTFLVEGFPSFDTEINIGLFAYLGIFNSVIAFLLWNTALEKIGQIRAGMFFYLIPLLTAVSAFIVFGEKIVLFEVIGGVMIIAGMLLLTLKGKTKIRSALNKNYD